jgi:hypothetical protein
VTAASAGALAVRVAVADAWETFALDARPTDSMAALKRRALEAARVDASRADRYEVKAGGALVPDESRTLAELGVASGAQLVVLFRRRRPVR